MSRIRRALRKPPHVLARRLAAEVLVEVERVRAPRRARGFDERSLLRAARGASVDELWERVVSRAPRPPVPETDADQVIAAAEAALQRRVDVLGSGPVDLGRPIDWLRDPKSGRAFGRGYAPRLAYVDLSDSSDVKLPWEISRLQWLLPAGRAYATTNDERYALAVREVLDEWIAANPYAGTVNWSVTMEVALRLLTLAWLAGALGASDSWRDRDFRRRYLRTLWLHGDYTARHLEHSDVNGNHFTADATGLAFAGLLFDHARWSEEGWRLLREELPRQVHPDGVDFEASASYHRLVCELFLAAAEYREQLGLPVPADYHERLRAMARFTAAIVHPDGCAPLWGDADDARALPLDLAPVNDHRALPRRFGIPAPSGRSAAFPDGGVYVLSHGADHVVIDCGPVGLAGRGGHGHNDCLSLEATLGGTRVLTDSGSYVYTASAELRNAFRATDAHNTPIVDGAEQNRIPDSLWLLIEDARPEPLLVEPYRFRGSHTGYLRLDDPVRPVRTVALEPTLHALLVHDEFEAALEHTLRVPYHLAAGLTPTIPGDGVISIGATFVLRFWPHTEWTSRVEQSWVSPSYGVRHESMRIVFERRGPVAPLTVVLAPQTSPAEEVTAWAKVAKG